MRTLIKKMKRNTMTHHKGFSLIEVLIVISIIGLLSSFAIPHLVQAHYKGKAMKIVTDMRAIRDIALTYNMDLHKWPESSGWGVIPKELEPKLPPSVTFDLSSWNVKYAYSDYSSRSAEWIEPRGYTVILRARVSDRLLANAVLRAAPDFFNIAQINRTSGLFTVILE
jgi:prepilin-type N-terminal cleavage/methylation domain-containing protein